MDYEKRMAVRLLCDDVRQDEDGSIRMKLSAADARTYAARRGNQLYGGDACEAAGCASGSKAALNTAVENDRTRTRYTLRRRNASATSLRNDSLKVLNLIFQWVQDFFCCYSASNEH